MLITDYEYKTQLQSITMSKMLQDNFFTKICGNPCRPDTDIQTNAPFRLNIYRMTQLAGLKKDRAQICSEQPESQVSAQTALCLKYEK